MGKGFFLKRTSDPSSGLFGLEREQSSDYFTGCRAGKSVPPLWDMEEPDSSSVPVLNSGLCNMKCLGVLPVSFWMGF